MQIFSKILDFLQSLVNWWIVRVAKKKQEQRIKEKNRSEKFEKETQKNVIDGDIDDINEKLKF